MDGSENQFISLIFKWGHRRKTQRKRYCNQVVENWNTFRLRVVIILSIRWGRKFCFQRNLIVIHHPLFYISMRSFGRHEEEGMKWNSRSSNILKKNWKRNLFQSKSVPLKWFSNILRIWSIFSSVFLCGETTIMILSDMTIALNGSKDSKTEFFLTRIEYTLLGWKLTSSKRRSLIRKSSAQPSSE